MLSMANRSFDILLRRRNGRKGMKPAMATPFDFLNNKAFDLCIRSPNFVKLQRSV